MRIRGTALLFRDNCVLLVRDRGKRKFSLPGGGKNRGESALATTVRELKEELGMSARSVRRLFECDFTGSFSLHKVSLIETDDPPRITSRELEEFIWWDQVEDIPRYAHVDAIVRGLSGNHPG